MNYFFLIFGILLSVVVVYDFAHTTLSANGVGWLTGQVSRRLWKVFLFICRHKGAHPFFNHSGMVTILANLFTWITLCWVSNALIFLSDPSSVVNAVTHLPATTIETIYFTGNSLATLGMGDFRPNGNFWKLFTVIVSLSGLSILTIAITYLVQVLTAEIGKRQLSLYIATLGGTPQGILLNGWNGQNFSKLEKDFYGLSTMILAYSQNHLAYPILHHFHSSDIKGSSAINLTALDEALTILLLYVPESARASLDIGSIRKAMTTYLITLESDFIKPSENLLPLPDLSLLRDAGIPLLDEDSALQQGYQRLVTRRRLLKALLENDGWLWNDLNRPKFRSELDL
ncbi:MAG: potassium channel family protein [Bacteroidota bacterium]